MFDLDGWQIEHNPQSIHNDITNSILNTYNNNTEILQMWV